MIDLERVPAWRNTAARVLAEAPATATDPGSRVRLAELALAAGAVQAPGGPGDAAVRALAVGDGDPALRRRAAFVRARVDLRAPGAPMPAWDGDDPLDDLRRALLDAEHALYAAVDPARRRSAFVRLVETHADVRCDDWRFEALAELGRDALAGGDADRALVLLERAEHMAANAPWDLATLGLSLLAAHLAKRDLVGALAVVARFDALPEVAGQIPKASREQMRAVRAVQGGELGGAVVTLDQGLTDAAARSDWAGYTALALAKLGMLDVLDLPYEAYRATRLNAAALRRAGQGELAASLLRRLGPMEARIGAEAWAGYGARLVAELQG